MQTDTQAPTRSHAGKWQPSLGAWLDSGGTRFRVTLPVTGSHQLFG